MCNLILLHSEKKLHFKQTDFHEIQGNAGKLTITQDIKKNDIFVPLSTATYKQKMSALLQLICY
jgi:hypothetical protein